MLNFEQVKLLEEKVAKAIEYVEEINREKNALLQRETELQGKLEFYQKWEMELQAKLDSHEKQEGELQAKLDSYKSRMAELEVLVGRFKEDHGKIEESILAALDRLNRFEKDIEQSLPGDSEDVTTPKTEGRRNRANAGPKSETPAGDPEPETDSAADPADETGESEEVSDPLIDMPEGAGGKDGELEIF